MDNERYDDRLKFIVIGNCGTGKSCILHRFIEGTFTDSDEQAPTIGVDFGAKVVDILGRKVKMQIWDTTGQERYRSMTRAYYKGALGCLLVYDITNRDSFEAIEQWLADVKNHSGEKICVMLVGNKSDLGEGDRRQVTHIEASTFANNHGLMHFETSAATGDFIEEAFIKVWLLCFLPPRHTHTHTHRSPSPS